MPSSPSATQLACKVILAASASAIFGGHPVLWDGGNADDEASAQNGPLAALGRRPVVVPGLGNRLAMLAATRLLPRRAAIALASSQTAWMYRDGQG